MQKALKGYRTKRKLADTLIELLNTKPLEKVRIHELTEQCDIHRQTFYYHFADIYALFTWCIQQDAEELSSRLAQLPTWQEALNALLCCVAENRGYFTAILDHAPSASRQAFFDKILTAVLKEVPCLHAGVPNRSDVSELYFQSITIMLMTLLEKWIRGDIEQPQDDIVSFLAKLTAAKTLA